MTTDEGRVELIVCNSNTNLASLVVEVKRADKLRAAGSMPQLMAETIVVALKDAQKHDGHAVLWGALTDVCRWCGRS